MTATAIKIIEMIKLPHDVGNIQHDKKEVSINNNNNINDDANNITYEDDDYFHKHRATLIYKYHFTHGCTYHHRNRTFRHGLGPIFRN